MGTKNVMFKLNTASLSDILKVFLLVTRVFTK